MAKRLKIPKEFDTEVNFLKEFFRTMQEWEQRYSKLFDGADKGERDIEEVFDDCHKELCTIHKRLCTGSKTPVRGQAFTRGGAYDPEGEIILEVSRDKTDCVIRTHQTTARPPTLCVYRIRQTPSGLRVVDDRKRVRADGELVRWPL